MLSFLPPVAAGEALSQGAARVDGQMVAILI